MSKNKKKSKYEGKIFENNQGCKFKVIQFINSNNILIEFQDKYKVKKKCCISMLIKKNVKNPYYPSVCGVGYIGNMYDKNMSHSKEYICWQGMLERCYDEKYQSKHPTYVGCSVCEEWKDFGNFYDWITHEPNYNKWKKEKGFQLDKDIISKGNKKYSPTKCCLVPMRVNYLWTNCNKSRGKYPIGVHKRNVCKNRPYVASITIDGKTKSIGQYATPEEAFQRHKEVQEANIKRIAKEEYAAGKISKKCYEAMMKYNIEITD